jgi:hypothetical protein
MFYLQPLLLAQQQQFLVVQLGLKAYLLVIQLAALLF